MEDIAKVTGIWTRLQNTKIQNTMTARMYIAILKFNYLLFFLILCLSPSIKKTNLDKRFPKNGIQNFSYKNFIKIILSSN